MFSFTTQAAGPFDYTESKLEKYSQINLTWWGFKVYKAELFTPKSSRPDFEKEILLHIMYQRDIEAEDLLESTLSEWKDLGLYVSKKSEKWVKALQKIWPNVKEGDSLTTYLNGEVTSFYQKGKLLGQIKDKEFGPLFLKIWLHKKSKTAKLMIKGSK